MRITLDLTARSMLADRFAPDAFASQVGTNITVKLAGIEVEARLLSAVVSPDGQKAALVLEPVPVDIPRARR